MAGKGQAEGCASCARWCLIIFNILFCLIGIGLVVAGAYAYIQLSDYLDIVGNANINAPAIVLIAFGCITFFIAALGCIGACKESACMLFTFAVIIAILLIAEIAAGIAAVVFKGKIRMFIDENAPKSMINYEEGKDNAVVTAWDKLQEKFECCGINGSVDWNIAIPKSCGNSTAIAESRPGCVQKLIDLFEDNIAVVAGVGIAFGLIELLGIILACCVGCNVRKGESA